jgi:hypothetical protein
MLDISEDFTESFFDRYGINFIEIVNELNNNIENNDNDFSIINRKITIRNCLIKEKLLMKEYYNELLNNNMSIEYYKNYNINFRNRYFNEINNMNNIIQQNIDNYNDKSRYIDYEALTNIEKIRKNTFIKISSKELVAVNNYIEQIQHLISKTNTIDLT